MSQITIGRLGTDITLNEIDAWDESSGGKVRWSADFLCSSVAEATALRAQAVGLLGPDEPIVPVVWSDDSTRTGFYRVLDVSVPSHELMLSNGIVKVSGTLERVVPQPGRGESYLVGSKRAAYIVMGTGADYNHGVPADTKGYAVKAGGTYVAATAATRTGPGASISFYTHASLTGDLLATYTLPPGDWYDGAAKITANGYTVVGRECPYDVATWSLTNGIIKIEPGAGSGLFQMTLPIPATPTSWGTPIEFDIGYYNGGWVSYAADAVQVHVLRNSPVECGIRLVLNVTTPYSAATQTTTFVDLLLRRGAHVMDVYISSPDAAKMGISTTAVTALTAITGGVRRTSDDTNGNRFTIHGNLAYTTDLVNGRLYLTAANATGDFGLGFILNGGSAAAPNTSTDIIDQYAASQRETLTVTNP